MEISRPFKWTVGNNSQNVSTHRQINRIDQREMIEMNGENSQKIDGTDSDATVETWYENEYVVEKVGRLQYYLKWKDYPDEDNTWEDESDIFATNLIDEYWAKKGGRPMTNTSSSSCSSAVVLSRRRRHRYNAKDKDDDTFMIGSTSYDDNDENQAKSSRHKNSSTSHDDGYLANYKPVPAMPRLNNKHGRPSISNPEIEEEMWEGNVQRVETVERDKETKEF
ncbi:1073_t:CDS:2 [Racocetra fulgida]|uniref:1073_t:CDS:1 n=1 Tax=Racocetra fulgida TaxID=60492 RepID=A0A9N8WGU4_9GLOM|nr:1073_t:CDS:2 [Racocetra fulgida]